MTKKTFSARLKEFAVLTVGTSLVSAGVVFLKFPNNFSTGGVSGISILLGRILPFVTPGLLVMLLNLLFLVLGFVFLNRSFGLKTVYCSMLFSLQTSVLERLFPLAEPLTNQPMLELVFAVLLPAVGSAMLFHFGASTGGTDIAAMILRKFTSLDIGKALLAVDFCIAASALFLFGPATGMYSLLGLMLKSIVVDAVIESINMKKSLTIVTDQGGAVLDYIHNRLNRGATIWEGKGSFTGQPKTVILTALSRVQARDLRNFVYSVDPAAFIFITNSSEIFGKGFQRSI